MEILGFIVLIACLVIGVRFGGLGLAAVSGIGLTFFVFVVGLVPGKPPIDVMLTIMAVVTCSGFLQASKGLDVMLKYAEKLLRKNPKQNNCTCSNYYMVFNCSLRYWSRSIYYVSNYL